MSHTRPTKSAFAAAAAVAVILSFAACAGGDVRRPAHGVAPNAVCTRYASPYGSDRHGHGTFRRPFASLARLDRALRPGQTGCLLPGRYGSIHTWSPLRRSGSAGARIVLRSLPGHRVVVMGWIEVIGSYTTLRGLNIDGSNTLLTHSPAPGRCPTGVSVGLSIEGTGDILEHNNIYQSIPRLRGTAVGIGWQGSGDDAVIRYNRIHDVGQCLDYDHLIYLSHGRHVRIYDNWLWHDPHGWGIQVYPAATDAQIFANVIDDAGSGFTIGGEAATSHNAIFHNVVMNSTGLPSAGLRGVSISDWWESGVGSGNVFFDNDSWGNRGGIANVRAVRVVGNVRVDPRFVNAAAHDYRLRASSPLRSWGLWAG